MGRRGRDGETEEKKKGQDIDSKGMDMGTNWTEE